MEKILLVTSKYSDDKNSLYLTNDLARAFVENNCKVVVVGYGGKNINRVAEDGMLNETIIEVKKSPKYLKYMVIWLNLFFIVKKIILDNNDISRVIFIAPLTVLWPAILALNSCKCHKRTCIIFDIFPEHQVQIASIPRFFSKPFNMFEVLLLQGFKEITGMSPANVEAIKRVYGRKFTNKLYKLIPPWGRFDNEDVIRLSKIEADIINFVFGGQICKGRDFTKAVEFLSLLIKRGNKIRLSIFTDNMSALSIKTLVSNNPWIELKDSLSRKDYLRELSKYDFGLIVTDPKVNLPTFPSKIIDYIASELPCVCLIEEASDFDKVLHFPDIIYINRFKFDDNSLANAEKFIYDQKSESKLEFQNARSILSVNTTVKILGKG